MTSSPRPSTGSSGSTPSGQRGGAVTEGESLLSDKSPQCVIYAISTDGKTYRYVGQTCQFSVRKRKHLVCADDMPLPRWIRKHKEAGDPIVFTVLEECSRESLDEREMAWIANLRAEGFTLLNLTEGGGGMRGWTASEETRAKQRALKLGKPLSEEHKAKIRASNTGRKRSAETCAKSGDAKRGRVISPEHRAKLSIASTGKSPSEETRQKLSEAARKQWALRRAALTSTPASEGA